MADNKYYISAGLVPIDNSTGATEHSYYISAGLVPDDEAAAGGGAIPLLVGGAMGQTMGSNCNLMTS